MKMPKLSLVAALALGSLLACTTITSAQDTKDSKEGKKGRPGIEQMMERLTKEVTLTAEQQPKVKAVLEESQKNMMALKDVPMQDRREKAKAIREEETKKIKEILTPEQFEKYQKVRAMRRPGGPGGPEGEKKKAN